MIVVLFCDSVEGRSSFSSEVRCKEIHPKHTVTFREGTDNVEVHVSLTESLSLGLVYMSEVSIIINIPCPRTERGRLG